MYINHHVINALSSNYLTADELIYLYNEYFKYGWDWEISPGSILKLKKTGFLDESGKVSVIGESLLLDLVTEVPIVPEVATEEQFEEIWSLYPRDDSFRQFPKTRTLRWNKVETLRQYKIARQTYSHEQLMFALKNEISDRNGSTIKNMFTYMKSSVNWFKDQAFLDYMTREVEPEEEHFHGKNINI